MERCKSCDRGGQTLELFFWLLRAAAAEAQFPFHWKGWPKARVGTPALAVRPMPVTRNSDAHITTPPFGHPFLKKKGNWDRTGTTVPMRGINYGRESRHVYAAMFWNDFAVPNCPNDFAVPNCPNN